MGREIVTVNKDLTDLTAPKESVPTTATPMVTAYWGNAGVLLDGVVLIVLTVAVEISVTIRATAT